METLKDIKNFDKPFLEFEQTRAGAELWNCLMEAFDVSLDLEIPVQFSHNERIYILDAPTAVKGYLKTIRPR